MKRAIRFDTGDAIAFSLLQYILRVITVAHHTIFTIINE